MTARKPASTYQSATGAPRPVHPRDPLRQPSRRRRGAAGSRRPAALRGGGGAGDGALRAEGHDVDEAVRGRAAVPHDGQVAARALRGLRRDRGGRRHHRQADLQVQGIRIRKFEKAEINNGFPLTLSLSWRFTEVSKPPYDTPPLEMLSLRWERTKLMVCLKHLCLPSYQSKSMTFEQPHVPF